MEEVLGYLLEKSPIIALVFMGVLFGFFLSKWYHRFMKVEEKVGDLPCEKHDDLYHRIVKNEEKVNVLPCSKHENLFRDIREQLVEIRTILTIKSPIVESSFLHKNSPRELNEAGVKLFNDIKGEEFLTKNKEILIKSIDDKNPKTAFDVEESALAVLFTLMDNDMFIGMKNWVYNSSPRKILVDGIEKDYVITMNEVCFVLSLPLRNMYLELHPELQ